MLLAKLKIVRRLPSIWSHRKIIVHDYFRLVSRRTIRYTALFFYRRKMVFLASRWMIRYTALFFYRRKMVFWNTSINNMPVLDKRKLRVFNFLYNEGIIDFRTGGPDLCRLPIFAHRDGAATIFLECNIQGFYAALINALENARHCIRLGLLPRFVWGKHSIYFDSQAGQNVWEYFFKQPSSLPSLYDSFPHSVFIDINIKRSILLRPYLMNSAVPVGEEDSHDEFSYAICYKIVKHFYTDLMLPGIIEPTQDICLDGCIGVQLRSRTLHLVFGNSYGISERMVYETYRKLICQALDQPGVRSDRIFLATDSELIVNKFKEMFPGQIMVSSSTRYKVTEGFVRDYETSGYQKGIEVIRDVELLRRCAWFISCSDSSMSQFLYFLSPNQSRINVHKYLQLN